MNLGTSFLAYELGDTLELFNPSEDLVFWPLLDHFYTSY